MTKFVTAVFIESENYLDADDTEHPLPNVDVQSILFSGKKVIIDAELGRLLNQWLKAFKTKPKLNYLIAQKSK